MHLLEFFSNHTFRTVFIGTTIIGCVAGGLGSLAYLRKQSLVSDVISHAALPGTLGAFLIAVTIFGIDGRSMPVLLAGAIIVGTAAVLLSNYVATASKLKIDSSMAVILSLFFGTGLLLMRIIANGNYPGKGGIQDYLFGNASTITLQDLRVSAFVGAIALCIMVLFWKEFSLRIFDSDQVITLGFNPKIVDTLMFSAIVIATTIGVKAVGLVLMVAFVITPPAAARQWTRTMPTMVALSAAIGGIGSALGAYLSISVGNIPTGPVIVLTLFAIFVFSLIAAPRRSIIARAVSHRRARNQVRAQLARDLNTHGASATPTNLNPLRRTVPSQTEGLRP